MPKYDQKVQNRAKYAIKVRSVLLGKQVFFKF